MRLQFVYAGCALWLSIGLGVMQADPAGAVANDDPRLTADPDTVFSIGPDGEVVTYGRLEMLGGSFPDPPRAAGIDPTMPPEPSDWFPGLSVIEPPAHTPAAPPLRPFEPIRPLPALPPDGPNAGGHEPAGPVAALADHQFEPFAAPLPPAGPPRFVPEPSRAGWMGGASLLILAPTLQNLEAYAINSGLSPDSTTAVQTVQNFPVAAQAAPLIWLGWQFDSDKGVRARFFWFDALSTTPTLSFDPDQPTTFDRSLSAPAGLATLPGQIQFLQPGNSVLFVGGYTSDLTVSSYTRLYALDFEYTHERRGQRFDSVFTAGGRYLGCDQSYSAFAVATGVDSFTGDTRRETQTMNSLRNFSGGGPTASWLGRMRLGQSRMAAYVGLRGSLLAGSESSRIDFVNNDFNVTTNTLESTNGSIVTDSGFGVLPIGEIDLGIEYGGAFWDRLWFMRTGVVAQNYFGLGSATGSTGDFILIGAELAAGLRF